MFFQVGDRILTSTALKRLEQVEVSSSMRTLERELDSGNFKVLLNNVAFTHELANLQSYEEAIRIASVANFDFNEFEYYSKCMVLCECCVKEEGSLPDDAVDTVVKIVGCSTKTAQTFVDWITPVWDLLKNVPTVIEFQQYGSSAPIVGADGKLTIDPFNGLDSNLVKYYRNLYDKLAKLIDGAGYILLHWCLDHLLSGCYHELVLQLVVAMRGITVPEEKNPEVVKNLVYYV